MLVSIMGKWSREATVMLIEEVKKHPFIYDPFHKSYHNRRARREAMNHIAAVISEVRPDTQGEEIKVRWNALRSAFQACISKMRRQLNGTLSTDYTKVWYFDDMLFLCKVRAARSGSHHFSNEGAETEDSFVQNEDVHHLVTVVEDSVDGSHEESQMCEIYTPESLPRKEVTTDCFQRESLLGEIIQREQLDRESLQRVNLMKENLLNIQQENLQRENLQRENLQRESLQRENLQKESLQRENNERESLQRENPQRESVQGENFTRENLQKGNLQKDALPSESLQGGNLVRENVRRDSFLGDDLQVDEHQSEDVCVIDPLADRDPPRDTVGSRRKRNHETAFHHSLELAVKKLIDRPVEDADFTFGKLVAHELKSIRSPILRRKLKHKIMMDIIEIQNLQD